MQLKIVISVLRLCAFLLNRRGSKQAALAWAGLASSLLLEATLDEMGRLLARLGASATKEHQARILNVDEREAVRGAAGRFIAIHRGLAHLALDASPVEARREAIGKAVHLNEVELTGLLDAMVSRLYDEARAAERDGGSHGRRADARP